jgi:very-short-patch-repair endonuclease
MQKVKKGKVKVPRVDYADVLEKWAKKTKPEIHKMMIRELQFHPGRKFRFDMAFHHVMLAIEVDGVAVTPDGRLVRGGGSHSSSNPSDYIKNNLAIQRGWRVLRYTSTQVKEDYLAVLDDIEKTIKYLEITK